MNDEELITAFGGAEDLINSRPITYQTANPEDNMPLTPNHFYMVGLERTVKCELWIWKFEVVASSVPCTNLSVRIFE